jgi:hypothetical protein
MFYVCVPEARSPHVSTSSPLWGVGDGDWTAQRMTTEIGCFTSGEALTNGQQAATKWVDEAVQLFKPRAPSSAANRLYRVQADRMVLAQNMPGMAFSIALSTMFQMPWLRTCSAALYPTCQAVPHSCSIKHR